MPANLDNAITTLLVLASVLAIAGIITWALCPPANKVPKRRCQFCKEIDEEVQEIDAATKRNPTGKILAHEECFIVWAKEVLEYVEKRDAQRAGR